MKLNELAKTNLVAFRNQCSKIGFDLVRVFFSGQAEPASKPSDVCVDTDCGQIEGVAPQDVGRLASYSGQGNQITSDSGTAPSKRSTSARVHS